MNENNIYLFSTNSNQTKSTSQFTDEAKIIMTLNKLIDNNQIDEAINIIEEEKITKENLNILLNKTIQTYRNNKIDLIHAFLNHNANINNIYTSSTLPTFKNSDNVTILMYSCLKGDLQLVDAILNHNPNINMKDSLNRNALFYAINADKGDNADIVLNLIKRDINCDECEKEGNIKGHSPLTLATMKNLKSTVKVLLSNKVNVNWVNLKDGNSSLHYAIINSNFEIVKILIENKANIRLINKDNQTPLSLALNINSDIYRLLVDEENKMIKKEDEMANLLLKEDKERFEKQNKKKKKIKEQFEYKENEQEYKENKDNIYDTGLNGDYNITENKIEAEKIKQENRLRKFYIKSKLVKKRVYNNYVEYPFKFKDNLTGETNQINSLIKFSENPILHIDLSSKDKEDVAILKSEIEELKNIINEKNKKLFFYEDNYKMLTEENMKLNFDLTSLSDILNNKEKFILTIKNNEEIKDTIIKDLSLKLDNLLINRNEILKRNELLEKEIMDLVNKKENFSTKEKITKEKILERKFSLKSYDDKYIISSLQKDIIDFQEYTKEQIKNNKIMLEDLLKLIQTTVNDCLPDYDVKLYGSHATNLCLPYSDLDLVLINKKMNNVNINALTILYQYLLDKSWKKTIKFIDSSTVPIIKLTSADKYNNMQIDISLQDNKHYGLKCVQLVLAFLKEYEALEPLILALKNLLKNANLNDPYSVNNINSRAV